MTSFAPATPLIPRSHLFGSPSKVFPRISQDGQYLAWLAPVDGVLNIWVAPSDTPERAFPVTHDTRRGVLSFSWTYAGHYLVYPRDADGNEEFHIYAVDAKTRVDRDLTPFEGVRADVVAISRLVRDRVLVRMNRRDPKFFDLYTLKIDTGELRLLERNDSNMGGFVVDEHYRPRVAGRFAADGTLQLFDRRDDANWKEWFSFAPEDARVSRPIQLNADGSALFMLDSRGRDTAALVRLDLPSGERRVLGEDSLTDVDGILVDADTHEPVGYSIYAERQVYLALTPEFQSDLDFLAGRDLGEWDRVSRTEDDLRWVIVAQSDLEPSKAYLYNRESRTLEPLFTFRPELADAPLVPMRPVTITARDGLELVSYVTRPRGSDGPGALVLLVHGGPWARDTFGFYPEHQWLANRGYSVLSVNFRGSTGFGKAFVNAGDKEWGRRMDDDLLDAVGWAIREGIADPKRIAIMGGSYGGYAVLNAMTRNPDVYACGVDIVGPSNLETLLATVPSYWESMRGQLVKALGDPSTDAGLALLRERSPVYRADQISKPLLIAQGANDPRVKRIESDQMVAAMKSNGIPVTYLLFPDEGHGFVRPANRLSFYAVAEAFLERHLGGRAEPIAASDIHGSTMELLEGEEMVALRVRAQ
ncbi:S9 family peptidase [Paraburkholderia sp. MMS20-SJTN17]|uniref:S9 family peptidase n=1 Tax=Paraburkholderia translucens TaxID=2886945 RepID=A0ABS8KM18_9BURK|nr:S9 family peptidase [Paraburkholderia sp. MMS20-SJTN17]MCC8405804.1 S9 family peptidase [Paraburkholderia sp. MMS20-SJTN17]